MQQKSEINMGQTERWITAVSGGLMMGLAVLRPSRWSIPLGIIGGFMLYTGSTGKDPFYDLAGIHRGGDRGERGIRVERSVTIERPRAEVYQFWRDLENLPRFMKHLESVQEIKGPDGRKLSHWVAKAPLGRSVEWDAEITAERENEMIAWKSLKGSTVATSGLVEFRDAPGDRGTEVNVIMEYNPPGGSAGASIAKLFREEPDQQINEDLDRFKQIMETGVIATVKGQSSGRVDQVRKEREGFGQ